MSDPNADVIVIDPNRTVAGMMAAVFEEAALTMVWHADLETVDRNASPMMVFVNLSADPSRVMELPELLGADDSTAVIVTTVTPALIETFCPAGTSRPFTEILERPFSPAQLAALCQQEIEIELDFGAIEMVEPIKRDRDAFSERLLKSGEFESPGSSPSLQSASGRHPREPSASARKVPVEPSTEPEYPLPPGFSAHEAQTVAGPVDGSPVLDIIDLDEKPRVERTRTAPVAVRDALDELEHLELQDALDELEEVDAEIEHTDDEQEIDLDVIDIALETGDNIEPPEEVATSDVGIASASDVAQINDVVESSSESAAGVAPADPATEDDPAAPISGIDPIEEFEDLEDLDDLQDLGEIEEIIDDVEDLSAEAVVLQEELIEDADQFEELPIDYVHQMPAGPDAELADVPPPAPAMPAHVVQALRTDGSCRLWPLADVLRYVKRRAIQGAIEIVSGEQRYTILVDGPFIRWCEPSHTEALDFPSVLLRTGAITEEQLTTALEDPSAATMPLIELLAAHEAATVEEIYEAMMWQVTQWTWEAMSLVDGILTLAIQLEPHQLVFAEQRPLLQLAADAVGYEFFRRFPDFLQPLSTRPGMRYLSRPEFAEQLSPNGLTAEEQWVLDKLREPRTIDGLMEMAADSALDVDLTMQALHRLREFDAVLESPSR